MSTDFSRCFRYRKLATSENDIPYGNLETLISILTRKQANPFIRFYYYYSLLLLLLMCLNRYTNPLIKNNSKLKTKKYTL